MSYQRPLKSNRVGNFETTLTELVDRSGEKHYLIRQRVFVPFVPGHKFRHSTLVAKHWRTIDMVDDLEAAKAIFDRAAGTPSPSPNPAPDPRKQGS